MSPPISMAWTMLEPLWGWPPPVLDPAGPYASSVTVLAWALMGMGTIVTAIVVAALWVSLKGPASLKARLGGERTVWVGGIAFPGIVLTILLIWGLSLTAALSRDITGDEMRIRVTGEMWWWRVQYLDENGEVVINDANEVHLPTGRRVVLELLSGDVIHSFWVPHLSGKKDMIPGRTNLLQVQADEPGQYGGVCTEFCGGPHALMGFVAVAHEPEDWERWFADRVQREQTRLAAPGPVPAVVASAAPASRFDEVRGVEKADDPAMGRALFMASGCAACHRVAGTEANGLAGPDLTHLGSRLTLGAGILPNHRGTLMGWIGDSQSIKPGNRMPSYDRLSAQQIAHIAAWLEEPQ